jgi:hypothetical protein
VVVGQGRAGLTDELGPGEVDLSLGESLESKRESSGEGDGCIDEATGFVRS